MGYFVEEKHTNREFVWILKNKVLFSMLMLIWFIVSYFIVMLVVLTLKDMLNIGILTLIGTILFFILFLGFTQLLNKFFDIMKARWNAWRQGRKMTIEFKGNDRIVRIEK